MEEQLQEMTQLQSQVAEFMPMIVIASIGILIVILIGGAYSAYKRRKINQAILDTQKQVREIKSILSKQSSSYLSNVATSNTPPDPNK